MSLIGLNRTRGRVAGVFASLAAVLLVAAITWVPGGASAQAGPVHKVVIQVSSDDPANHRIALNNAVNLQQALGEDGTQIEIVAYGPGISIMTADSEESARIPGLSAKGIRFSACGNTMKQALAKSGRPLELVEGVQVVPAGVLRIMELQEQGYTYIRP